MPSFYYERIVVLESLPTRDHLKTGEELCDYLTPMIADGKFPPLVQFEKFTSASELKKIIERLTSEVLQGGHVPILHIETHGLNDGSGLSLADGSEICWTELIPLFLNLNKATRFNLIIVLAACYTGDLWEYDFRLEQPSFFLGLITPSDLVRDYELLGAFREFYKNLLENTNAWDAFEKLVNKRLVEGVLQVRVAHLSFWKTLEKGYKIKFTSEEAEKMIASNNEAVMKRYGYLGKHVKPPSRQSQIQVLSKVQRDMIVDLYKDFFMTDLFPENEDRFGYIKVELISMIDTFWRDVK